MFVVTFLEIPGFQQYATSSYSLSYITGFTTILFRSTLNYKYIFRKKNNLLSRQFCTISKVCMINIIKSIIRIIMYFRIGKHFLVIAIKWWRYKAIFSGCNIYNCTELQIYRCGLGNSIVTMSHGSTGSTGSILS